MAELTNDQVVRLAQPAVVHARRLGVNWLRWVLVLSDALGLAVAQALSLLLIRGGAPARTWLLWVFVPVVAGMVIFRMRGLFLARISSIRVIEATRLGHAMVALGVVAYVIDRLLHLELGARTAIVGAVIGLCLVVTSRSIYRAWLGWARSSGRYTRRVVVVGTDDEAARMRDLFECHKEVGVAVVAVVGDRATAVRHRLGGLWRGAVDDTEAVVDEIGASGVIVCPGILGSRQLNALIRRLQARNVYVHLGLGVSGVDNRRLQSLPLAYEPLLYCEPPTVNQFQVAVKRAFDVAASFVALVLLSPLMGLIALAIVLDDGRPVFFRQERVGRHGRVFRLVKFRTMIVDAEAKLAELQRDNQRHGPLFKMERDPRITRVGRFLRNSSLDELPQLWNVLMGEMSLVGPRPALPKEVEQFSDELRVRERVRPGITGLWQVEARDNPSFDAYQRLDTFYLDNWSTLLDVVILVGTVEQVLARFIRALVRHRIAAEASAPAHASKDQPSELMARAVGEGDRRIGSSRFPTRRSPGRDRHVERTSR